MKLGLMPGDAVPATEMRSLGFDALQMFYGWNRQDDDGDPTDADFDAALNPGELDLAAMTVHIDLVGPQGAIQGDVDRAVRLVHKTAALKARCGDNEKPILVWHPSGYPEGEGVDVDDAAVFKGLCEGLGQICRAAEASDVHFAVELTRDGSVYSAETFLRIKDQVASPALRVCLDAANIVPDRTPLVRAVRSLASDIVIVHAKDSKFGDNGVVDHYGPVGTGKLDYATYIRLVKEHCPVPYLVLEYYQNREELLRARDIILEHL